MADWCCCLQGHDDVQDARRQLELCSKQLASRLRQTLSLKVHHDAFQIESCSMPQQQSSFLHPGACVAVSPLSEIVDDHITQGHLDLILQASRLTTALIICSVHHFDDIHLPLNRAT
jgi:hypothetical protein